MKWLFEAWRLR